MMIFLEYTLIGLIGGSLLLLVAKTIMAELLRKDENYYEKDSDGGGEQDE